MAAQPKLKRLLEMMELLRPPGISLHRFAAHFEVSKRTAERYVQLFEEAGLCCEKDATGRYFLFEPFSNSVNVRLSSDEAVFLSDLLLSSAPDHPLSEVIQLKLYFRSNSGSKVKNVFRRGVPQVVETLLEAMRAGLQVEVNAYYSAIGGKSIVRIIEPFEFTDNYRYLLAYEATDDRIVNLKVDRIAEVKIRSEKCKKKPDCIKGVDVFHIAENEEKHQVSLRLNSLAYRLLLEEYPQTENLIHPCEDPDFPFWFSTTVYNFLPLGRFCLGLPGAIHVESPPEFIDYLRNKTRQYTWQ
jgi:predicted DNA-binding transcriptional regulator YafY